MSWLPPTRADGAEEGSTDETGRRVYGRINFAHPKLTTGSKATEKSPAGFRVRDDSLAPGRVPLTALPAAARLDTHGVEALNLREELIEVGIPEGGFEPALKEHRFKVGRAVLRKVRERFPEARVLHLCDTSRVDFGQEDGEVTVRDTADSSLRGAHVAAHMDKHLPGIAECWGFGASGPVSQGGPPAAEGAEAAAATSSAAAASAGAEAAADFEALRAAAGARRFVNLYEALNGEVWSAHSVPKEDVEAVCLRSPPRVLNVWVALTPGGVTQHPLAVADARTLVRPPQAEPEGGLFHELGTKRRRLSGEGRLRDAIHWATVTAKVELSGDFTDTLTLLKPEPGGCATWWWRPRMAFGDALVFSTCETPHSAVVLEGKEPARRISAEMRVLVLPPQESGA